MGNSLALHSLTLTPDLINVMHSFYDFHFTSILFSFLAVEDCMWCLELMFCWHLSICNNFISLSYHWPPSMPCNQMVSCQWPSLSNKCSSFCLIILFYSVRYSLLSCPIFSFILSIFLNFDILFYSVWHSLLFCLIYSLLFCLIILQHRIASVAGNIQGKLPVLFSCPQDRPCL